MINQGKGIFVNETDKRLPRRLEMTREVISADVDNDGDVDIYYATVSNKPNKAPNRLLLNNLNGAGKGYFTDATKTLLHGDKAESTFTALFSDLNGDKFPDLIVPSSHILRTHNGIFRFYLNSGDGQFNPVEMKNP